MRRCGQCTVIQPGLLCEQLCEQTHSRAVFGSFHAEHKDRSPLSGPIAAADANSPVYQLVRPRCKVWQGSTHGIAMSPSGNGSYAARPLTPSSAVPGDNTNMSSRSPKVRPAVYHLSTHITTDQDTSLLQSTPTSKYFVTSPTYSHSEQLRRSINLKPIPLSQLVGVTQAELFRHCRLTTTSDSRIT